MCCNQVGLVLDIEPLRRPNISFWPIKHNGTTVGKVNSAVHSSHREQNVALAMMPSRHQNSAPHSSHDKYRNVLRNRGPASILRPIWDHPLDLAARSQYDSERSACRQATVNPHGRGRLPMAGAH